MKPELTMIGKIKEMRPNNIPVADSALGSYLDIVLEVHTENFIYSKKEYMMKDEDFPIEMKGNRAIEAHGKYRVGDIVAFKVSIAPSKTSKNCVLLRGESSELILCVEDTESRP